MTNSKIIKKMIKKLRTVFNYEGEFYKLSSRDTLSMHMDASMLHHMLDGSILGIGDTGCYYTRIAVLSSYIIIATEVGMDITVRIPENDSRLFSWVEVFLPEITGKEIPIEVSSAIDGCLVVGDHSIAKEKIYYLPDDSIPISTGIYYIRSVYNYTDSPDMELVNSIREKMFEILEIPGLIQGSYNYAGDRIISGVMKAFVDAAGNAALVSDEQRVVNFLPLARKPGTDTFVLIDSTKLNPYIVLKEIFGVSSSYIYRMNKDFFGKLTCYGKRTVKKLNIFTEDIDGDFLVKKSSVLDALEGTYGCIPQGECRFIGRMIIRRSDGSISFIKGAAHVVPDDEWNWDVDVIIPNSNCIKASDMKKDVSYLGNIYVASGEYTKVGVSIGRQLFERGIIADDVNIREGFESEANASKEFLISKIKEQMSDLVRHIDSPSKLSKFASYKVSYDTSWYNEELMSDIQIRRREVEEMTITPLLKKIVNDLPLTRSESVEMIASLMDNSYYVDVPGIRMSVASRPSIKEGEIYIPEEGSVDGKRISWRDEILKFAIIRDDGIYVGLFRNPTIDGGWIYKVNFRQTTGNIVFMNSSDIKRHQGDNDDAINICGLVFGSMEVNPTAGEDYDEDIDLNLEGVLSACNQVDSAQREIATISYLVGLRSFYKRLDKLTVTKGALREYLSVQEIKKKVKGVERHSHAFFARDIGLPVTDIDFRSVELPVYNISRGSAKNSGNSKWRDDIFSIFRRSAKLTADPIIMDIMSIWKSIGLMTIDSPITQEKKSPKDFYNMSEEEKAIAIIANRFINLSVNNSDGDKWFHTSTYMEPRVHAATLRGLATLPVVKEGNCSFKNLLSGFGWPLFNRNYKDKFIISRYISRNKKYQFVFDTSDNSIISMIQGRDTINRSKSNWFRSREEVSHIFSASVSKDTSWKVLSISEKRKLSGIVFGKYKRFSDNRSCTIFTNNDGTVNITLTIRKKGKFNDFVIKASYNDIRVLLDYLEGRFTTVDPTNNDLTEEDVDFINLTPQQSRKALVIRACEGNKIPKPESYESYDIVYLPKTLNISSDIIDELRITIPRHIVFTGFNEIEGLEEITRSVFKDLLSSPSSTGVFQIVK